MATDAILGPGGTIAAALANYEPRPQQLAMADAVADALADALAGQRHLMVEAGTGVGKSFAYLVPAIQAVCSDPEARIVLSTHTISLQEQLLRKDIPFLQKVMPHRFSAMLVKGRGNYLSQRRLRVARQRSLSLLTETAEREQLAELTAWAKTTRDGSRSDLDFRPLPAVWDLVESDSSNCLGKRCANYDECFYFKARRNLQAAQILVVNHALFFSDLALRSLGRDFGILPKYRAVIFDEAHNLEDVAADHLGLSLSRGNVEYLLNKLLHERKGRLQGLLSVHGDDAARNQVYKTRLAAEEFFHRLHGWRIDHEAKLPRFGNGDALRVRVPNIVPGGLAEELKRLAAALDALGENVGNEEEQIEIASAAARCGDMAASAEAWLGQALPEQVYWLEGGRQPSARLTLASAPVDVGPILREKVFDRIPSVVLTSATLSVSGGSGFDYFRHRLGFPEGQPTLHLGSPFNFRDQAELHLFRHMPDPSSQGQAFEQACLDKIESLVVRSAGRAFVLFTSTQTMIRAANQMRRWLHERGFTLLCQSDGIPAARMVEQFRQAKAPVLFGVDSFWQGVDVQGETLSNVIIAKLPFAPPDRPLVEARSESIAQHGGQPFVEYVVPQAVIKLKQGFGRLIRTATDRGIVAILDPRVLTKPYGRDFLAALPPCRRFIDGVEVGF